MSNSIIQETVAPVRLALRAPEAAKAIGISERSLWSLTHDGDIPHFRVGTSLLYPVDALRRWLDEQVQCNRGSETPKIK